MGVLVDTLGRSVQINNIPGIAALDRRIDEVKKKRDKKKRNSRLVKYQRDDGSMHRHYEPSSRWKRLDKSLKVLEHRRRERIKQVLYSHSHALFDNYDVVGIGNWAPDNGDSGLGTKANRTLRGNRYLGKFRSILIWVALKRRKLAFVLDEKGTTRTCSACGYVHEEGLAPSIRKWECPRCHLVHGRDENAATNGLKKLLLRLEQEESLLPCSGLRHPFIRERSTWSARPGSPRRRKRLRGRRRDGHEVLASGHGIKGSARTCGHDQGIMMPVSIPPTRIPAAVQL